MNMAPKFEPSKTMPVKFAEDCGTNTPDETILDQVRQNIRRGLPQVQPHQPNPDVAIIVCGGPSLKTTEEELVEAYWAGGKIVACNGAYQWCIDRNLKPSAAIMLDAREFNVRFIEQPVDKCKYLLASQCHPRAFDICKDREVLIWHACSAGEVEVDLLRDYYFDRASVMPKHVTPSSSDVFGPVIDGDPDRPVGNTFPVTIGTTIGLRAISVMRMLGFSSMEIFGLDSCWLDDAHHSYDQPENNKDGCVPVWLRPQGRDDKAQRFMCSPWHIKQADDFLGLIKERGHLFQLNVHGPGLLATILRTGAEIQTETER